MRKVAEKYPSRCLPHGANDVPILNPRLGLASRDLPIQEGLLHRRPLRVSSPLPHGHNISRNNDAGEAAEVGVGGDELGVEDASGGVNDGVRRRQAVVEA